MQIPFYDPSRTYEDNYTKGPFGAFVDKKVYRSSGTPKMTFLGQKVYLPFGIPAGPLLNSNFIKGAFEKGFDLCVYKTVRSDYYPCHPFPNVLSLVVKGDLKGEKLQHPQLASTNYSEPISITNSFGVPSKKPEIWQEDVKKAISYEGKGQVVILSFMGTVREGQTQQAFIDDYILAAKLAAETRAKILEVNLSCPNIGNEGLVCYNIDVTKKIAAGIREVIGNTPLILKIGYFEDVNMLKQIAEIAHEYAHSIAAINTLQVSVVNAKGEQALPGKNRLRSGVCGDAIRWAGLKTVKQLVAIRDKNNFRFSIEGIGGVMHPNDYFLYKDAGADSVMSATGAMWNPFLAKEIKEAVNKKDKN